MTMVRVVVKTSLLPPGCFRVTFSSGSDGWEIGAVMRIFYPSMMSQVCSGRRPEKRAGPARYQKSPPHA
jgi:hypothetical protein